MPSRNEDNIFFISDFDDQLEIDTIIPLTQEIEKQAKLKEGRIDLYVNSGGGYAHLLYHFIGLVEIAKSKGVVVRTIVPDIAFSAGSMLAVAGTEGERYIGRQAEHLVHYGSIMSFETTPSQVERYRKWKERQFKKNLDHYKKYCDIKDIDKQMLDDGWFIPAKDAIKFKMADKYWDKMPVLGNPGA